MYIVEIRKKSIRLLLICIGIYIVLGLTIDLPITIGMGIICPIHSIYKRSLIKNNEIIDCDRIPYYIEMTNFKCILGVLCGASLLLLHF